MSLHHSLLTVLFVAVAAASSFAADRPNVLFVISDDLGSQSLGCYGNPDCRTPHIDRLAVEGTQFTRTYCQYPVCGPSRAALMSGLYAQTIGVTGNGASDKFTKNLGDRPSMAEHFKRNGWHTARVSKIYHMLVPGHITAGIDGPDHLASWTERFNCQAPEWYSEGEAFNLTNETLNFDREKHYGLGFGTAFYVVKGSTDGTEQADVQAATKAIELMRQHREGPFFLAVGFVRPHVPLVAPASYHEPYPPERMTLPESVEEDRADIPKPGLSRSSIPTGLTTAEKKQQVLSAYYASVTFMDAQVGRLLAALDELKLRDNTIVVFTADHGYHLGEHDLWQKMSLHEESTRIPLIVSVPGKRPNESDALAEQIDIYPTLAELAGLPVPEHVQGKSLAGLIDDPEADVREAAYCLRSGGHLLRTDRWAFLSYPDGSGELYDMQNDPQQFTNLIDDAKHAPTLADMRTRLQAKLAAIAK
jgi:iduronate 2-sulfatase